MAAADGDDSLYPIAVLIDELRNEDVQVRRLRGTWGREEGVPGGHRRPSRRRFSVRREWRKGAAANQCSAHTSPVPRTR